MTFITKFVTKTPTIFLVKFCHFLSKFITNRTNF